MTRLFWILGWFMLASCSRVDTQTYTFSVPEAENLQELEWIRSTLLKEQEILPEGVGFYERIQVSMDPSPTLTLTVHTRQLRKQNLIRRLHDWGYSVENRPGDPEKRTAFLAGAR